MMRSVLTGVLLALMLRFPATVLQSALEGLQAFTHSVLPLLFPYMVFCQLAGDMLSRQQRLHPVLPCAFLGALGGSPAGARLASSLYQARRISWRELRFLSAACGTVSPMFILGTLTAWTGQPALARCVLISHWAGVALCGALVFAFSSGAQLSAARLPDGADAPLGLTESISRSVDAMLSVCGCMVLFSVLAAMPGVLFPALPTCVQATFHAVLEMSGGSQALIALPLPRRSICCALSACVSFGGLSILMQNATFLLPCGIKTRTLVLFRLLHALAAGAFGFLLYPLAASL